MIAACESSQNDQFSIAAGAIGVFLSCLPFYVSIVPPMADLPAHVLVTHIILNFGDPILGYHNFFEVDWTLAPTSLFYIFLALLQKLFGPVWDSRIYLTIWVIGIWLSVSYLARVLGNRNPWTAALLALPVSFCGYAYQGFLPFLMSLPLFALTVAVCMNDWKPVIKVIALWVLFPVLLGFHIVGAAAAGAVSIIMAFATANPHESRPRNIALTILAMAPLVLMTGLYLIGQRGPTATILYSEPLHQVLDVIKFTVATLNDSAAILMLLWVCGLGFYGIYRWRSWGRAMPIVLAFVFLVLLSVAMPNSLGALWPAGPRLLPFALLLLIAGMPWPDTHRAFVSVVGLCLLAGLGTMTTRHALQLDQGYRDILGAAMFVENGKRVLPIIDQPDHSRWVAPYLHAGDWITVFRGGTNPHVLATPYVRTGASPLRYRHDFDAASFKNVFEEARGTTYYRDISASYDYVLVAGSSPAITELLGSLTEDMNEVYWQGSTHLFARRNSP